MDFNYRFEGEERRILSPSGPEFLPHLDRFFGLVDCGFPHFQCRVI